jgi:hypothetical protein
MAHEIQRGDGLPDTRRAVGTGIHEVGSVCKAQFDGPWPAITVAFSDPGRSASSVLGGDGPMGVLKKCKQDAYTQPVQLVVLSRTEVSSARRIMNLTGTMVRRMRNPLTSLRWELAKRHVPRKSNLPEPESASAETAVALAGY